MKNLPALLKGIMSVFYIGAGVTIFFVHAILSGISSSARIILALIFILYGCYRLSVSVKEFRNSH
jgi:hypothetical protein